MTRHGRDGSGFAHGRFPRTVDPVRLVLPRPGRHRHADRAERAVAICAELEACPDGDGQADAGIDIDDVLLDPQPSPHLAASSQEEPNLIDRMVGYSARDLPGAEFKMSH